MEWCRMEVVNVKVNRDKCWFGDPVDEIHGDDIDYRNDEERRRVMTVILLIQRMYSDIKEYFKTDQQWKGFVESAIHRLIHGMKANAKISSIVRELQTYRMLNKDTELHPSLVSIMHNNPYEVDQMHQRRTKRASGSAGRTDQAKTRPHHVVDLTHNDHEVMDLTRWLRL